MPGADENNFNFMVQKLRLYCYRVQKPSKGWNGSIYFIKKNPQSPKAMEI